MTKCHVEGCDYFGDVEEVLVHEVNVHGLYLPQYYIITEKRGGESE